MDGSDSDVSSAQEEWDDMAIVRAFEDALTDQKTRKTRQTKKAARQKPQTVPSTPAQATPTIPTDKASSPSPVNQNMTQEQLYQAALAQAMAYSQSFLQQQRQAPYPPSYPPFYGIPQQQPQSQYTPSMPWGHFPQVPPPQTTMPPPPMPSHSPAQDDLSNLLLAWYQSGYYTGRYQAMQEMRHRHP